MTIFAPPEEEARKSPLWLLFVMLWVFWLAGNLAVIPIGIIAILPAVLGAEVPQAALAGPGIKGLLVLITLYVMFAVFAGAALFWVRKYERRSFASMGLAWRGAVRRYAKGLLSGLVFAGVIFLIAAVFFPDSDDQVCVWSRLLAGKMPYIIAALIGGLLIQSAAEEIILRGWIMSSVAMAHGRMAAVMISALFFGSLHAQFLFGEHILAGLVAMGAITLMGVMLGLYALRDGSIIGAAGFHGAFNISVFGMVFFGVVAGGQIDEPFAALNKAFEVGSTPQGLDASSFVQGGAALLFALYYFWRLRRAGSQTG